MKLYFLRHGRAQERADDLSDYDRRLTAEGIDEMMRIAQGLSLIVDDLDLIFSSPLPRALETARIAARALRVPEERLVITDKLAAGAFSIAELQSLLANVAPGHRIMLVGHEPDFSMVVEKLSGATIEMKKAGLAFVEVHRAEPGGGVLRWLLTPRHLQLLRSEPA